jgi:hypothetical protein
MDASRAERAERVIDELVNFLFFDPETNTYNTDREINGGDCVEFTVLTLNSHGFLPENGEGPQEEEELPAGPQFILILPDGLKDYIKSYSSTQLRRRLNVFINGRMGIPGTHYALEEDGDGLAISMARTEVEDIVICDPRLDEKWYWQPHGWGRL